MNPQCSQNEPCMLEWPHGALDWGIQQEGDLGRRPWNFIGPEKLRAPVLFVSGSLHPLPSLWGFVLLCCLCLCQVLKSRHNSSYRRGSVFWHQGAGPGVSVGNSSVLFASLFPMLAPEAAESKRRAPTLEPLFPCPVLLQGGEEATGQCLASLSQPSSSPHFLGATGGTFTGQRRATQVLVSALLRFAV